MTTLQTKKDPARRGVSPTPSKIPVSSRRRPRLPTDNPGALDQENQDPMKWAQKVSTPRSLHDSAHPRPKASHQTKKSERLVGSPQFRNPLEELKPSPGGRNVGPGPPPQTEASGTIEFVADPAALATILSGEGVKSCQLGRHTSLAQRVLIRGRQGGSDRRGQGVRASAYVAPKTPAQRLDPTRASCFSRMEGPGPRGRTLCPQRLEGLIPSSGASSHPSTYPSFQELRRDTGNSGSQIAASQASGLLLDTPVQPAPSLPGREHDVVTHSGEGGGGPLSLAQRVPLRETQERTHNRASCDPHQMFTPGRVAPPPIPQPSPFGRAQRVPSPGPSTQTSYSVLRRLALHSKTQYTPLPSASRVQRAQPPRGLSPQPCPEEPAVPWEQITVRLFDQETHKPPQEGAGRPSEPAPAGPSPSKALSFQEVKMQRIAILQQLLRQELLGLAESACAPPSGGAASLDMPELQPLIADVSRTLGTPEHHSGTLHLPGLSEHSESPKPPPPEECGQPQPGPGAEPEAAPPCAPAEPGPWEARRSQPALPEASAQERPEGSEPGPLRACTQRQAGLPEPSSGVGSGDSETCSLGPRSPETSHQGAPVMTSPSSYSETLRPLMGQTGARCPAPHTLALRQRLQACLSAIHCFHEARLNDECAFYTSRAPPGPTRTCTNPVATLLEWQDALSFIPVGSAALQDSPS